MDNLSIINVDLDLTDIFHLENNLSEPPKINLKKMKNMQKITFRLKILLTLSAFLLLAGTAKSITISGTLSTTAPPSGPGYTTGAGIQQGRLNRDGNVSMCPTPFTSSLFSSAPLTYHSYTFTPTRDQCVTVTFDSPDKTDANVQINAYNENGFDPNNVAANQLASSGLSTGIPAIPTTFSFPVRAGVPFTLDVFDTRGRLSAYTFDIDVEIYNFSFFEYSQLLSSSQMPYFSSANAGSDVSVSYSLGGYKGANPYSQPPASQQIRCYDKMPIGAVTPIQTYPGDPFYNPRYDLYTTVWRTQASWAGTCRRLFLYFNDGSVQTRDYRFN